VSAQEAFGVPAPHVPVLLDEVIAGLAVAPGETHVDGTFGAGGYTRAILEKGAARVYAFDRDPDAIQEGEALAASSGGRLTLVPERFSRMRQALAARNVDCVDGVTLDIGVSSMQLDQPERGFAFSSDGPLDMTMEKAGFNAADFVNEAAEEAIADVLFRYAEERQSRRVARAIVAARPLTTTGELANVVRKALGHHPGMPKDPATRSFQAIRIHVNGELDELSTALVAAEKLLGEGGRLAVVSFHSLEDRIVKQFLREAAGALPNTSRHLPQAADTPAPRFTLKGKAIRASDAEIARNPRARSATLRAAIRTSTASREAA
jgi:16S rRNA (cytosine1402-N4)-methyltransferase